MSSNTVAQFAVELKMPADVLLEQLRSAGVEIKSVDDDVTDAAKAKLLESLRRSHGGSDGQKITLTRRQTSEIRQADSSGRSRTISVEVRKKRVFVKRDPSELLAEAAKAAEQPAAALPDSAEQPPVQQPEAQAVAPAATQAVEAPAAAEASKQPVADQAPQQEATPAKAEPIADEVKVEAAVPAPVAEAPAEAPAAEQPKASAAQEPAAELAPEAAKPAAQPESDTVAATAEPVAEKATPEAAAAPADLLGTTQTGGGSHVRTLDA